ncbi:BZ3500_MvSof-1268-A1-R1_Chr11-2g03432 [Microbotryum saponariae]|uniref:BZ3500_MvSof-1268-A1-R1_Chr11-2g03432 protein n=1 Tax=Microbotryum saponariae TaxID=289078 RepID=A0A2X0N7V7_9BASI|nr:BZ3500_MvSof-1268-A1-R1_Chr11-2g03432 [Microbotryum saponariae]SDA03362.1 BZ3501_MvSof-1269-A2-R1_Chr11g03003 [Microbotryum saponariae]
MDIALHYFDEYAGDAIYSRLHNPLAGLGKESFSSVALNVTNSEVTQYVANLPELSVLPRDSVLRQCISLYGITYVGKFSSLLSSQRLPECRPKPLHTLGILLLYFSVATFSYYFIFDHRMKLHPRWLKNQVRKEIMFSLEAFPMLDLLTLPWFLGDVRGYSQLYDSIAEGPFGAAGGWKPWAYMAFSVAFFLWFTDYCIYWIHRWLHIPFLYRRLHKPHHKWIIPSPFASHAFHPVDGYLQSVPYHIACYMFPIHKYMFIGLFSFVNLWSIFIHDSDMLCGHPLEHYINGPAHHTLHHIYFTCNYGQYFTWADKVGGSFRVPAKGDDPLDAVLAVIEQKKAGLGSRSSSEESLRTTRQRVLDLLAEETTSESGSEEVDVATMLSVKKSQ